MQSDQGVERPGTQVATAETTTTSATEKATRRSTVPSVPRWAGIGIFFLLLIAAMAQARDFLLPVVLGFLLALIFSPVRRFLERRGIPAGLSALLIVSTLVAMLLAGVVVLSEPVTGWIDNAPKIGRELERKVQSLLGSAKAVMEVGEKVDEIASGGQDQDVPEVKVQEPGIFASMASVAPAIVAQVVFTLVLLLFLLASGDMFYEKLVHVMPTFQDKRRAIRIAYDIERKLSHYLFTITLINAGLGVSIGLAMWQLHMPNPLLFGVVGFALNYVPYLGAISGTAIATIVGLISFDQIGHAVLPGIIYFTLTSIEGQFITPYFVGRRLEMNTVVIFLTIAFWAWLWSIMGMLVAVPLLVAIRAFCEHIPELEPVGEFISARNSPSVDGET
jgi:predicted PurR-regulated permease PerM